MSARSTFLLSWRRLGAALLALAAVAPPAALGLPWTIRVWQSDEGLPDNTVVGTEQTPDGFLWVATPAGLVRFDGVQFRQFTSVTTAGLPTSVLQAMVSDHRGRLWVAKEQATVVCVDQGRTTTVVTAADGLPNREAHLMVADSAGAVWLSYLGGEVARIQEGRVRTFTTADGLPGGGTCQLAIDHAGQLWFSQGKWVGLVREGKFRPLVELGVQRITGARAGGIWACAGKQVYKCSEGGTVVKVGVLPGEIPEVSPTVLREDQKGDLWIGTAEAGLFRYDSQQPDFTKVTSNQHILTLKEDRDGILWVGTRGAGLNQVRGRTATLATYKDMPPFTAMRSISANPDGRLWMVAQNGVVYDSQLGGGGPLSADMGWSLADAQCVAADPHGGVWIGSQKHGLHHWHNGALTKSLGTTNGLAGDSVNALLATSSGHLWIGTESLDAQQHAVQCWHAEQFRTFRLPPASGAVAALAVDAAGDCRVATARGLLLRVHQEVLMDETAKTLAEPHAIRALWVAADGSLWIGYGGQGLGRLKAGRFTQYRMDQGLADDYISHILPDERGRLWLAGNTGIFSVFEQDLDDLAAGRSTRVRSVTYGRNDGLPRLQPSHGSWPGAVCTGRRLFFAMQSGVAVVYANEMEENKAPPNVVLDRVTVNGKTAAAYAGSESLTHPDAAAPLVELAQGRPHLRLPPGARQVEFVFTGLSFKRPDSIGFKYRLHGLDADWVEADTRRVAAYPQIPPGDYRFQVLACNSDGVWNETGAAVDLTIEPNWWETAWFRVLAPLAAAGLLGGGVLLVLRRRHRRQIQHLQLQRATERERARIAQDLHDDLGAGLTQISLNTAMAQNPSVPPALAGTLLDEIDQRSRTLVIALDEIVWAVNPKNDTTPSLARYFCQFAQNFLRSGNIACRLVVAPDLADAPVGSTQRHQLFLAFKEALHNALRHSGATELQLEITADTRSLTVTLADNGRGFSPGPVPEEGADGLDNMRARLERLGGTCQVTSAPGRGTTVVFRLPLADQRA